MPDASPELAFPVADVDAQTWARNSYVATSNEHYSMVANGAYHRTLKIPITRDRRVCLERHRFRKRSDYHALGDPALLAWLDAPPAAPPIADGAFFVGSSVHWHYLIDGLGTLVPMQAAMPRQLYVDAELSDSQLEFLLAYAKAAGYPPFERVARLPGGAYRVENGFFFCAPRYLDGRVAGIRSTLGIGSLPASRGRRLFVLRNGAAHRRLLNQEQLAALVQDRLGFEVVDPSRLSVLEQARAFHDAEVVMGPHGSGLANAIFAARLRCLVELFHSVRQPFYESLSKVLGASHIEVGGTPRGTGAVRGDNADYEIDGEALLCALEGRLS